MTTLGPTKQKKSLPLQRKDADRNSGKTLRKIPTGIAGFDEITHGGLPHGRTTIVFGGPGCGKTLFALQTLVHGAQREPAIFVAFEESKAQIISNASTFGWNIPELERKKRLHFVDAQLKPDVVYAGKFDLIALLAVITAKVKATGATRIVFDGINVLLTLLENASAERNELFRINEWVASHHLTAILTARAESNAPFEIQRYAYVAYMSDCAILLSRRHENVVSERDLTVLKYRGSGFAENRSPFVISPSGLQLAVESPVWKSRPLNSARISSGIDGLDVMLNGGFYRGSTVLISGLPGTAKSNLSAAFIDATCRRRERGIYVSFDERPEDMVRNFASLGIRLKPFIDSGQLKLISAIAMADSSEVQIMRIRDSIQQHRPRCVVIEPVSALRKSSDGLTARGALARFMHWCKSQDITLVSTSLLESHDPDTEGAKLEVSTVADTWIHLSYAAQDGERRRSLTIIKSRGTKHSSQVCELFLSDGGITLTNQHQADVEVGEAHRREHAATSRKRANVSHR